VNVPALLEVVTQAREAATAVQAAHAMAMVAKETAAQEAVAVQDSANLCVNDAEDRSTLVMREAPERVSRVKAKNAMALASAREDAEGFAQKIALLVDELAGEHRTWEMSEMEHRAQFEELTLLQTWGSKLCHAIIGPPRARHHLSDGMWVAALCHTEMVGELAALWSVVSTAAESMLGHSLSDIIRVVVVDELVNSKNGGSALMA
jgi:hypothetical protein